MLNRPTRPVPPTERWWFIKHHPPTLQRPHGNQGNHKHIFIITGPRNCQMMEFKEVRCHTAMPHRSEPNGSTLSPWQHVHVVSKFYVPWQYYVPDKITNYCPSHNFALTIEWAIFGDMWNHLRSVVSTTFSIGWGWIHNKCLVLLNSTYVANTTTFPISLLQDSHL